MQAAWSSASTLVAYVKTQLHLDASLGSVSLTSIAYNKMKLVSSLSLVQTVGSNASTSVAYVKTRLDLDATRGSISLISIAYMYCVY